MFTENDSCRRCRRCAVVLVSGLAIVSLLATAGWAREARQPNIVLILADDLGWSDLACYGADLHETPHLDRLAREGLRFTNGYSASVCSPTRASLMTGKHYGRLHVTTWYESSQQPPTDRRLLPPVTVADLPHHETTIAKRLQAAGYLTALVGKWHLGDARHYPETHGFDVNIGGTLWARRSPIFSPIAAREDSEANSVTCRTWKGARRASTSRTA